MAQYKRAGRPYPSRDPWTPLVVGTLHMFCETLAGSTTKCIFWSATCKYRPRCSETRSSACACGAIMCRRPQVRPNHHQQQQTTCASSLCVCVCVCVCGSNRRRDNATTIYFGGIFRFGLISFKLYPQLVLLHLFVSLSFSLSFSLSRSLCA
jgi:hypothetical protein